VIPSFSVQSAWASYLWPSDWFECSCVVRWFSRHGNIVFRPDLVADPVKDLGSGFWPSCRVNFVFFKLKRRRFSKKTKVNGLQPGFWPGLAESAEFFLSLFFLQPGLVPALDRPARVLKLCLGSSHRGGVWESGSCCFSIKIIFLYF